MKRSSRVMSAAVAAVLCGCSGPRLAKAPDLFDADGTVKFSRTRDDQTRIDLAVKRLRQPEELSPPAYLYVAWVRGEKGTPALSLGALELDDELTGELSVLSPLDRFDLFVTAESHPEAPVPTGAPLLWVRHRD